MIRSGGRRWLLREFGRTVVDGRVVEVFRLLANAVVAGILKATFYATLAGTLIA